MEWDARETVRITDKMTLHFNNVQTFLVGQMANGYIYMQIKGM